MYDIILGRDAADAAEFEGQGLLFLGRLYVTMGNTTSLSNNVYLDVARSHVVLVCGKKGSGKSYTLAVIAEEIARLPEDTKKNLSVLMFDTLGIFWSMKYPNERQRELLERWRLKPEGMHVQVFTPFGKFSEYKERGIPVDARFSIKPSQLSASDWCGLFEIKLTEDIGILIERIIGRMTKEYDIDDIMDEIEEDKKSERLIKDAVVNRLEAVKSWGLFSKDGIGFSDLVQEGKVCVLDISCYDDWNIKCLVVGLVCKKLLQERMSFRKREELRMIESGIHYFTADEKSMPLVWLMLDECVTGDTEIITSTNHTRMIDVVKKVELGKEVKVLSYDFESKRYLNKKITGTYKISNRPTIRITTECGRKITCTPDHLLFTQKGYLSAISSKDVAIPLTSHYSENKELIKARLFGYLLGDGWLSKNRSMGFSGKNSKDDLYKIKEDILRLDLRSSSIHSRTTLSQITTEFDKRVHVKGTSSDISLSRKAFDYFYKLGAPVGKKVLQPYYVPGWILDGERKIKAEFLAGLMGADGVRISPSKNAKGDYNPLRLSFNKDVRLEKEAFTFASQIKQLFNDLGIVVGDIAKRSGNIRKDGVKTLKIVLKLSKNNENTLKFLEHVGYRYCKDKEYRGLLWLEYLKARVYEQTLRKKLKEKSLELKKEGLGKIRVSRILGIKEYEARDYLYMNHKPGVPKRFESFEDWISKRVQGDFIFEKVCTLEETGPQDVYDIGVDDTHNFVANGVLSHNCHEFLPRKGKTLASDALVQLIREGRQPGISLIMATQQPGEIHETALSQADIIISHRVTAKKDIEALNAIMHTYLTEDILSYLNQLPSHKGSAIVLDDNSERIYAFRTRPKMSWHGGESPASVKKKRKLLEFG